MMISLFFLPNISDTWNESKAKYRTTIELIDKEIAFFKKADRFITEYGEELYIKCVYCVFLREESIILLKLYEEFISKFK